MVAHSATTQQMWSFVISMQKYSTVLTTNARAEPTMRGLKESYFIVYGRRAVQSADKYVGCRKTELRMSECKHCKCSSGLENALGRGMEGGTVTRPATAAHKTFPTSCMIMRPAGFLSTWPQH